jgi:hypothetical protein
MDKCKGCLCNTCSCACQKCVMCANSEYAEIDWIDMYIEDCESYEL